MLSFRAGRVSTSVPECCVCVCFHHEQMLNLKSICFVQVLGLHARLGLMARIQIQSRMATSSISATGLLANPRKNTDSPYKQSIKHKTKVLVVQHCLSAETEQEGPGNAPERSKTQWVSDIPGPLVIIPTTETSKKMGEGWLWMTACGSITRFFV